MNQSTEVEPVEVDRRALEIRALHGLIIDALRRSVRDAIKIGLLLETQKAELPHGSFRLWVEEQLPFTERTARRYMALHRHRELIAEQPDLQSAYRAVGQIEPPVKTDSVSDLGKPKPNADSSTWLKDEKQQETEAEDGFKARVAKLEETAQAEQQQRPGSGVPDEFLDRILIEPVTIDEDLKLDDSGANAQQEAVFEMLTNYIDGQPDPNASLEVAHNLIKKLGRIVNRYQQETA